MTTIAFWKPFGTLTKFTDDEDRPTLADWIEARIPEIWARRHGPIEQDPEASD